MRMRKGQDWRQAALLIGALVIVADGGWSGNLAHADDSAVDAEVKRLLSSGAGASDGNRGTVAGLPATFAVTTSGRYHDQADTSLTIDMPTANLLVQLRPYSAERDGREQREGHYLDLTTGDAAFDAAYVVEGAPSDLTLALCDEPLRQALQALPTGPVVNIGNNYVVVMLGGWPKTTARVDGIFAVAELVVKHLQAGVTPAAGHALAPEVAAKQVSDLAAMRKAQQSGAVAGAVIPAFIIGALLIGLLIHNISRRRRSA